MLALPAWVMFGMEAEVGPRFALFGVTSLIAIVIQAILFPRLVAWNERRFLVETGNASVTDHNQP